MKITGKDFIMKDTVTVKKLTFSAVLMALTVILSASFMSIPVPGGHMYLNDVIIVTASVLLSPFYAAVIGGVGSFLGDLLFYPAPMFVSLFTHGLQAFVISVFVHVIFKKKPFTGALLGAAVGLVITVAGYTFGRAYVYGTPEYAVLKFPFQVLQTAVGSALSLLICFPLGLRKQGRRFLED